MSIQSHIDRLKADLQAAGDPATREQKTAYMKDQFEFYGLKAKEWVPIVNSFFKESGFYKGDKLMKFVQVCYASEYREMHYAAGQMIEKSQKKYKEDLVDVLEFVMRNNQWWDTIDWYAKLWGFQFDLFPDYNPKLPNQWIKSDDFWVQRTAIIFQLFYKERTNEEQLFRYVLAVADSKEFFLQKAAGWALRQYSKTAPDEVKKFINASELPKLTVREGLRLLTKS